MGFLSNLFSSTPDYPALDPNSGAGHLLSEVNDQLEELAGRISEPLEIIPSEHAAYVFIGKPPKRFGLAWVHDGEVNGLNTLVEKHGVKPAEIEKVMEELRSAYAKNTEADHYCADLLNRKVVVTVSDELEHEVHDIIDRITH